MDNVKEVLWDCHPQHHCYYFICAPSVLIVLYQAAYKSHPSAQLDFQAYFADRQHTRMLIAENASFGFNCVTGHSTCVNSCHNVLPEK